MLSVAAFVLSACLALDAPTQPLVAIVIDDLGHRPQNDQATVAIPGALTYAILPFSPGAHELARQGRANGRDILLHLPMEAEAHNHLLGPGALLASMNHAEFSATVRRALREVPYLSGVNNHMGSMLTRDRERMDWLMAEIRAAGLMMFLDSRTTPHSVAMAAARNAALAYATRDVFLDHEQNAAYISQQFDHLIAHAAEHGDAIGIAHPHTVTIRTLRRRLSTLKGTRLVALTELLRERECRARQPLALTPVP